MSHQNNVERIKTVFQALGELQNEVVFVGGATVSLYADQETFEVRETDDIDVIIEVLNYADHAKFEEQLRKKGFTEISIQRTVEPARWDSRENRIKGNKEYAREVNTLVDHVTLKLNGIYNELIEKGDAITCKEN